MSRETPSLARDALNHHWRQALQIWSFNPRLLPEPILCHSPEMLHSYALNNTLALVQLRSGQVLLNLSRLETLHLSAYLPEILAHEAGHLLFSPGSPLLHGQMLKILSEILPEHQQHWHSLANLWQDLLINYHLHQHTPLKISELLRLLSPSEPSLLWQIVLRTYELLWHLPAGNLLQTPLSLCAEADARECAWQIQASPRADLSGLKVFARICRNALPVKAPGLNLSEMTDLGAGLSSSPENRDVHQELTTQSHYIPQSSASLLLDSAEKQQQWLHQNGTHLSIQQSLCDYYLRKARPYLFPWKIPMMSAVVPNYPEGLSPWLTGSPIQEMAWTETLLNSPRIVPGLTTVRQHWEREREATQSPESQSLDLYLDASASLPNPYQTCSLPVLCAVIMAISALHQGWTVRVTLWSGPEGPLAITDWLRNQQQILQVLTHYLGGSTSFPWHLLSTRYRSVAAVQTHLLLISDAGFLNSLQHENAYSLLQHSFTQAKGGGSLILQMPAAMCMIDPLPELRQSGWYISLLNEEQDLTVITGHVWGRYA